MTPNNFYNLLEQELARLDAAHVTKREETVIEGFSGRYALINDKKYLVFNSNDYLGLRLNPTLKRAEHAASKKYGTGPGAVRFISGSLKIHQELETALAAFHEREAALIISSAFAANLAVLTSLVRGPGQETLVNSPVLVISDALNHRSIVDGIRLSQVPSENKAIFRHLEYAHLDEILTQNQGKFPRCIIVTDGIFSMLGQYADLAVMRSLVDKHRSAYPQGIILIMDDCHGIAAFGPTGHGTEEVTGARSDILVGTLGKGLGTDGGYIVGDKIFIDYLRESAATYIYSNPISPGTAGAAMAALGLLTSPKGLRLLSRSSKNIKLFKRLITKAGFTLAADSVHPIQPILIGDAAKTQSLAKGLFTSGFLATPLSYPVVSKGQDEIRVQISATHTPADIRSFVSTLSSLK